MRVYGVWWSGDPKRSPRIPQDVEVFDSLDMARRQFMVRAGQGVSHFEWLHREPDAVRPLGVTTDTALYLWVAPPESGGHRKRPRSLGAYVLTASGRGAKLVKRGWPW